MSLELLSEAVWQASRRYNSAAAVYQWAAEGKLPGAPRTTHTYPDLVRVFSGSCLEQLRRVIATVNHPFEYLRSTRVEKGGKRSGHYAAVCTVEGEKYLIDPNLGLPLFNLQELWSSSNNQISVETFPHLEDRRTHLFLQAKPKGVIEVGKAVVSERSTKGLGGESFNLLEASRELPGVGFDVRTPLHEGQLILNATIEQGEHVEVMRVQRGENGLMVRLIGAGGRFREGQNDFDAYLLSVADTCGTTMEDVRQFLEQGWTLFMMLRKQRDEVMQVVLEASGTGAPESQVYPSALPRVVEAVRTHCSVLCQVEQMQENGTLMTAENLVERIYEVGDWNAVRSS